MTVSAKWMALGLIVALPAAMPLMAQESAPETPAPATAAQPAPAPAPAPAASTPVAPASTPAAPASTPARTTTSEAAPAGQAAPLTIAAGDYVLDKTHASLTWKIKHLGLSWYTARFTSFDANVRLDPQTVTNSSVSVTIDPKSVRTDYPFPEKEDFDKVISEKFLKSGEFPTITFQSTSLVATDTSEGKLHGNLTLLGVTKPVTLDVKLVGATDKHPMNEKSAFGIHAKGEIKRSDFGQTELQGVLGDEIKLEINGEFIAK